VERALQEDLRSIPLTGRPLPLRLRNFRASADAYLAAGRGPSPYMLRLRQIEILTADHEAALREAWDALAQECAGDESVFERRWQSVARRRSFESVNDLIDRHNRWYPVESRLPMDPRTGDYVLVNGRDYRLAPLDESWVLERLPPSPDGDVEVGTSPAAATRPPLGIFARSGSTRVDPDLAHDA
jgi:hypothetical protein